MEFIGAGVPKCGSNQLIELLAPMVKKGLTSVYLVPVADVGRPQSLSPTNCQKSTKNAVIRALEKLRVNFPKLDAICDVCLCRELEGITDESDILKSFIDLAEAFVNAGAVVLTIAPRFQRYIPDLNNMLLSGSHRKSVSVMSQCIIMPTNYHGTHRTLECEGCNPKPVGESKLVSAAAPVSLSQIHLLRNQFLMSRFQYFKVRSAKADIDMLMIKVPAANWDLMAEMKQAHPKAQLFVYQGFTECCMMRNIAETGLIDFDWQLAQMMKAARQAGADHIITHFASELLDLIRKM